MANYVPPRVTNRPHPYGLTPIGVRRQLVTQKAQKPRGLPNQLNVPAAYLGAQMASGRPLSEAAVALGGGGRGLDFVRSRHALQAARAPFAPEVLESQERQAIVPARIEGRAAGLPFTPMQRRHELNQDLIEAETQRHVAGLGLQGQQAMAQSQREVGLAPFTQGQGNLALGLKGLGLKAAQQEPSVESQRRTGLTQMTSEALAAGQPLPDVLSEALEQEYQPVPLLPTRGQGLPRSAPPGPGAMPALPGGAASMGGVMQGLGTSQQSKVQDFLADGDAKGLARYLLTQNLPQAQINALLQIASGSEDATIGNPTGGWLKPLLSGLFEFGAANMTGQALKKFEKHRNRKGLQPFAYQPSSP